MDGFLDLFGRLLAPLYTYLIPASRSNAAPISAVLLLVIFGVLIAAAPVIADNLARRGANLDSRALLDRFARVYRVLRTSEGSVRDRLVGGLYRDGRRDSTIQMDSDLFLLVRAALGIAALVVAGALLALTGTVYIMVLGAAGYVLPTVIAGRHNRSRVSNLLGAIPGALRRLETRISAGTELREALARISAREKGTLYAELAWAAGQMKIPGNQSYEVLRRLDERNNIVFFAPLADQIERGARRGRRDGIDAFLSYIDKVLEDDETKRQAKIGGIANKIMITMVPFLLVALVLAIGLPFIVSFAETGTIG